jgi:hypothetical protein
MKLLKSAAIITIFSILLFFLILPEVFASTKGASGIGGGNLFLVIVSFGIVYISGIAWYLNKRSKEEELNLEFEKYDSWNQKK